MTDPSCVGEARRHAATLATALHFDDVLAGRLALVVTELGTNLVKHAQAGRLLLATRTVTSAGDSIGEVEVIALDDGPGIGNIARCMGDGFSTGGSPGTGLGAIKRLADDFDIHSEIPSGTVTLARVRKRASAASPPPTYRVGTVALMAPGESTSGDGWSFASDGSRGAFLVADGLGHGPDAARAAREALQLFAGNPFGALAPMMERAHAALRGTRGAAVTVARLDPEASSIRSVGAGNVIIRVVSGDSDRTILSQHGTVGLQIRRPEEVSTEWPRHAAVVVHTDGVQSRWPPRTIAPLLMRDPGLAAAVLARDFCRGRDDATVLVVRRRQ
jgi:anti-sigma regulatory factor (Ser/Thr protein kinase)